MAKIMLVNVTHVEESRVAVVDDGVLDNYEIETINRAHIKGNIYNAVVETVHPSLEAAFLKLTPDLKGFLPLDEVNFKLLPARSDTRKTGKIGQHLHPGQRIMAQVVREPFSGKPPTVSTYFSLPGRFLVLMPGVDSAGVSRKIEEPEQRERLKRVIEELQPPEGFGLIVRTAGMGQTKLELQRDLRYLLRLWQSIQRASQGGEFPSLVYRDADLVIRTIRDHFTPDISEVWIDSQETYDRAAAFVHDVMPAKVKTLRLYTNDRPLFNKFNLEEQIESIYKRRVTLPSGGEIVIDGTEALTAIDVNSARSKRQGDAEENATQTNLEAAVEIARQFRLRDLGGLIVLDFIDMALARNRKKVEKVLRDAMKGDKAKYDATPISKLGLVEISRQRIKGAKMGDVYTTCPTCDGYGLVKNVEAAALAALRKLQTRVARGDFGRVRLALPAEVATWILNYKRDDLLQLERRQQLRIDVVPSTKLLRHEAEIETQPREKGEEPPAPLVSDRWIPLPPSEQEIEASDAETLELAIPVSLPAVPADAAGAEVAGGPAGDPGAAGPRRRRRRRRRRGPGEADQPVTEGDASGPAEEPPDEAAIAALEPRAPALASPHGAENGELPPGATPGATDEAGVRRRRRRRRRGGRGRGAAAPVTSDGAEGGDAPETVPSLVPEPVAVAPRSLGEEPTIPRGVRSDELMPAARARAAERRRRFTAEPPRPPRGREPRGGGRGGGAGSEG